MYHRNSESWCLAAQLSTLRMAHSKAVDKGADGCASHSPETATALRDYAKTHNLLLTGDGDGHGTFANQEKYAIGIADVEDEWLKYL